jgi:putative FmdB family regulatory protein
MPLYEYECGACGHRFEQIRKFSDPPVDVCPKCGEPKVQKLVSSPAIQFKGSGWYITDYAKKSSAGTEGSKAASEDKAASPETKSSTDSGSSTPASGASGTTPSTPSSTKDS